MKGKRNGKILRKAIAVVFALLAAFSVSAINGYKITLKTNLNNHKVYLWYLYGENRYPLDTSMTNAEGTAVLEKPHALTGGVFVLYLTPRKALEFLLTEENVFTINIDTANVSGKTTFAGSKENTAYYDFLKKINFNNYQLELLRKKIESNKYSPDSLAEFRNMAEAYLKQERLIKKQTIEKNKGSFLADLIAAGMKPDVSRKNLLSWQRQTKKLFFENVNFADEALAFSPVLFNLYQEYINDYTYKSGDSLIAACDTILKKASAGKENFKWSLYFLSSSFERSSVPGQDQVFVHLVEEYYKKGKCWWLTPEQLSAMSRRAEVLKHLFIGTACPDFVAVDSSEKEASLYSKIKKLTVLYFWSYDCSHCLEETPKLAAWIKKHPNINLVTACATPDEEKWKEKLKEFKLPGTHFIDPEMKANYTYTYSVTSTPQIFVIGPDKKILAKYISDTQELDEFLKKRKK